MPAEHHHDLAHEFPQYEDKVHQLKARDPHFTRLYAEYQAVDKEIYRIEQEIETPSDSYTEGLKIMRARLKDQLYTILSS
jgi:uncharacterized protein